MRKEFVKLFFVLGVMAGGTLGTLVPANAEAGLQWCPNICANEDCSCYWRCAPGSGSSACVCEPFWVCE